MRKSFLLKCHFHMIEAIVKHDMKFEGLELQAILLRHFSMKRFFLQGVGTPKINLSISEQN